MSQYKYNPDSHKVHNVADRTESCNFDLMDGDETIFLAENNTEAMKKAKKKYSPLASRCLHCM